MEINTPTKQNPEILKLTNDSIQNIKENKNISQSIEFLQNQYSGTYLKVLQGYDIRPEQQEEYRESKKTILFNAAKKYDETRGASFNSYLYRCGEWHLSSLTDYFYKNEKNKPKICSIDEEESKFPESNFSIESLMEGFGEDSFKKINYDEIEEILNRYFEKNNTSEYNKHIIYSHLIEGKTFLQISIFINENKEKFNKKNEITHQRVEQIFSNKKLSIKNFFSKELNIIADSYVYCIVDKKLDRKIKYYNKLPINYPFIVKINQEYLDIKRKIEKENPGKEIRKFKTKMIGDKILKD